MAKNNNKYGRIIVVLILLLDYIYLYPYTLLLVLIPCLGARHYYADPSYTVPAPVVKYNFDDPARARTEYSFSYKHGESDSFATSLNSVVSPGFSEWGREWGRRFWSKFTNTKLKWTDKLCQSEIPKSFLIYCDRHYFVKQVAGVAAQMFINNASLECSHFTAGQTSVEFDSAYCSVY